MNSSQIWISAAVIALVTALLRFAPFWLFTGSRGTPKLLQKLSKSLPYAIMGMLVVYCLKDISFSTAAGFAPALISTVVVTATYLWRRSTLLSIVAGTVCNMLLVQFGIFM